MKRSSKDDDALIKAHLQEIRGASRASLKHTKAGNEILAADPDQRASIAMRVLELWPDSGHSTSHIASELLRTGGKDWSSARLAGVIGAAAVVNREHPAFGGYSWFPFKPLISAVEKSVEHEPLSKELRMALEKWKAALSPRALTPAEERELGEAETIALVETPEDAVAMIQNPPRPWSEISDAFATIERLNRIRTPLAEERKLIERLSGLLSGQVHIDTSDAVGTLVASDLAKGGRAAGVAWEAILSHARSLSSTTPSTKWLATAADLVAKIKPDKFGACAADWLNEAGKPGSTRITVNHVTDATLLNDGSVELLKGLAWTIVAVKRVDLAPALGNLAEACFKKIPNKGPRNVKVANAATAALAALADPGAASQLTRLRLRVKHQSSRGTVDKALAEAGNRTGLSPDDLAEISVPTFKLNAYGVRRTEIGEYIAELRAANSSEVTLLWFSEGKVCASVPAKVRTGHAEELKRLKREAKDASTMLAAQTLRLERSYISERKWPMQAWRERIFDHPLVGTVARRLIWQFDDALAIFHDGELVNVKNHPISPKESAVVSLWHPLHSAPPQVLAWRDWLAQNEITQPFKQAHREIYVLTDAERRTGDYSNRFAAHILRQHQLAALCQSRGWDYRLQGDFDSHSVPTLNLPAQNLTAEFWVEAIEHGVSAQGIFLHVTSDQVRFHRPLEQMPPVAFSEVMRDVDLFVGVAGVANDPTWQDGGPGGRHRAYWEHWSFGELSESARVRKSVLEQLMPKLKIASQCSLDEKYLVIRGALRTYKIHLGSGNILMEPNNQYLCIVPDQAAASKASGKVFLPFEGDRTLSIILSKAFLLAEDSKIKDQTILRQIQR